MSLFSQKELKSDIVLRKGGKIPSCISCKLFKSGCNSPKMEAQGKGGKKILIVLDYPNEMEDSSGIYLNGKHGAILKHELKKFGVSLFEDCVVTSAVRCSPQEAPEAFHIDSCRMFMMKEIAKLQPKLIICFGKHALASVIGSIWQDDLDKIEKWRGWVIPDQTLNTYVAVTYSIHEIANMKKPELHTALLQQDLKEAFNALSEPFPKYKQPNINVIKSLKPLYEIKPNTITAFDYETTGLKPHAEGHKIICASIATSENDVFVFKMPQSPEKQEPFIWYLKNKLIKKMAHNLKYEEAWSYNILGVRVKNWFWDSMLMAHVLDNRRGITSLKFQGYVHFGLPNYNIEVDAYLKGTDPDNANSKNRIEEFIRTERNLEHLLEYNAIDSIVEYRLAMHQQKLLTHILPF